MLITTGAIIRSQIWDLVPNGTKVPKWSQKSPNFTFKSQISDFTFRWCWKGEVHICSSQGTAMTIWTYTMHVSCTYLWYSLALSYLLIYFELSKVATTRFLLLLHFFFFLFMKTTTKAPKRSKNGPKKVPILPQRHEFCLCKNFSGLVPNPIFCIGAPVHAI